MEHSNNNRSRRFFEKVTDRYKLILILSVVFILAIGFFIPQLTFDTSQEAFIQDDNPVLVYRDKVKETFGLKDPMVIAVHNESGVFNKESLALVSELSDRLIEIPGIDPAKIMSIATEKNVVGTYDGLDVDYFYYPEELDVEKSKKVWEAVQDFDLYMGTIVSHDGKTTLIVAEYFEEEGENAVGNRIYQDILLLADDIQKGSNEIHVAGIGAVSDYLTTYIDADAKRLNPMAAVVITIILIVAYRTVRGAVIPNIMVVATAGAALGLMALLGIPFYVITNALPVVLIAIAVADAIHILGQYYEEARDNPLATQKELVIESMVKMWRPVTVTSVTTVAGFLAIAFSSQMPPFRAFGAFAGVGVSVALMYAIFFIPSALMLVKPQRSKAMGNKNKVDGFSRSMARLGNMVTKAPTLVVMAGLVIILVGFVAALQLKVDYASIDNFQKDEQIVKADALINQQTDGTTYLDIVVETPDNEGLFLPENLKKIESMQRYMETLPKVKGSTSIVDFIKKMHKSLNENQESYYKIPDDKDLIAQEFLLYTVSGDPTDFDNYVDYDYRLANVRVTMNSAWYTDEHVVFEKASEYIEKHFNEEGIKASLSGAVSLDEEWIGSLGKSHFIGMGMAILVVLAVAGISFKSFWAGFYTVVPVGIAILMIYAIMGSWPIFLGLGTTMFAAIAVGVGVDFAVHTVDRLIFFIKDMKMELTAAYKAFYESTGRALLFNLLALALGFGVLTTSSVPPLQTFGWLVAIAVFMSFIASLTILPAAIYLLRPKFIFGSKKKETPNISINKISSRKSA